MNETAEIVAKRFKAAGLEKSRFINVKDGEKKSIDHGSRWDDPVSVPGKNYGIYSDEDDQLVILDVDYYEEEAEDADPVALGALSGLPRTLKLKSPHVPEGDRGGHRVYKLAGDETPAELFKRRFGTMNPIPSWGEIVAKNKYVVGAGSQLDGCTKDFCERCAESDGGYYELKKDREIAEVDAETLVSALAADPELEDKEAAGKKNTTLDNTGGTTPSSKDYDELTREQVEEILEAIPGNQHWDDWIRTGYAVFSWDDGREGKEVFEQWSQTNRKWEEPESQRQIDYIWKNGDSGDSENNAGVGTLIHFAKENGWEPNWKSGKDRSVKELVAEYSDEYDDPEEVPDNLLTESPDPDDLKEPDDETAKAEAPDAEDVTDWSTVRSLYQIAEEESDYPKGNARRAAAHCLEQETDWMYVLESQRLWVYDAESGTFDRFGEPALGHYLVQNLGQHYSQTEKREIIGRVQDRNQVHREELNARKHDEALLCVGNGVVNLRTGEILDHSPEFRFVRGLSHDHDPDNADKETIKEFLDGVTERVEDRDTLLDHLAHGLMPGHPYRAFVVCYGPGGNGKTQVAELFRGFVGNDNAAAVEIDELTSDDFATGDLPGKFLNWGDDMAGDGGGALKDLSLLKKATGGSEIRANEKFEKTFDFKNEAAMFFSANEPPRIGEQKRSIEDRIYPIRMPYTFKSPEDVDENDPLQKEKTPNVSEKLLNDDATMRGLLALAIEHAQDLIESRGQYSQPESPEERLEKYNQSADPIVKYAGQALSPAGPDKMVRKDDAYQIYQTMVEAWSERAAGKRGFKRQFPRAFKTEIENARSRALATDDDDNDRVKCWKRLQWTDTAREFMPDWMEGRYSDHFSGESDDQTSEPAEQADEDAPEDIRELEKGFNDISDVTVAEKLDPPEWLDGKGTLQGPNGNYIPYVCEGAEPLADIAAGDEVNLQAVKIEDRKAGKTAVLTGVTKASNATRPEGQSGLDAAADGGVPTENDDSGGESNQQAVENPDSDDGSVPEDAEGPQADIQRLVRILEGAGTLSKHEIGNRAKEECDINIGRTHKLLDKAASEGSAIEKLENGEYRAL